MFGRAYTHAHRDTYIHKLSNIVVPIQLFASPFCARVMLESMPSNVSSPDRHT